MTTVELAYIDGVKKACADAGVDFEKLAQADEEDDRRRRRSRWMRTLAALGLVGGGAYAAHRYFGNRPPKFEPRLIESGIPGVEGLNTGDLPVFTPPRRPRAPRTRQPEFTPKTIESGIPGVEGLDTGDLPVFNPSKGR